MKTVSKFITGAAAAALLTVSAATPAEARDRYGRHNGIDAGDIITGVAVLGGIAAIAAAIGNNGNRSGYGYGNNYRDGYSAAVNACGYEAQRAGRGQVNVTGVDRRGNDSYRVRGVIDGGNYAYGRGYDRGYERTAFTCTARSSGRVTDFRVNNGYSW